MKKKISKKRIEKFEQKQRAKQEERTNRIIEMKKAGDKEALAREVRLMNKRLNERFRQIEKRNKHPEKTTGYMYAEVNGKRFYMGIFDKENGYDEFITLGAKKYAFIQNGKIGITVSGLSKKKGAEELEKKGGLRRFQRNEVFYNSGRTIAQYNSDKVHDITVDGCTFSSASNLAIVDTTYTLGISDTMLDIIERLQGDIDYEEENQ